MDLRNTSKSIFLIEEKTENFVNDFYWHSLLFFIKSSAFQKKSHIYRIFSSFVCVCEKGFPVYLLCYLALMLFKFYSCEDFPFQIS